MTPRPLLCCLLLLLPLQVMCQDLSLADALDGDRNDAKTPATQPSQPVAAPVGGGGELDLNDYFNEDDPTATTTKVTPKVVPKAPTKAPTKTPLKPRPKPAADELDLADALNPNNDPAGRNTNRKQGGGFSDQDLIDIGNDDTYKPDKGKGGRPAGERDHVNQYDDTSETTAEVGTIAGIVSAVAMALVGAVSSYISYQKKKLCFSIQQSLNADMVKAENPEVVVAAEPQVQETLLEKPAAEPQTEENTV